MQAQNFESVEQQIPVVNNCEENDHEADQGSTKILGKRVRNSTEQELI